MKRQRLTALLLCLCMASGCTVPDTIETETIETADVEESLKSETESESTETEAPTKIEEATVTYRAYLEENVLDSEAYANTYFAIADIDACGIPELIVSSYREGVTIYRYADGILEEVLRYVNEDLISPGDIYYASDGSALAVYRWSAGASGRSTQFFTGSYYRVTEDGFVYDKHLNYKYHPIFELPEGAYFMYQTVFVGCEEIFSIGPEEETEITKEQFDVLLNEYVTLDKRVILYSVDEENLTSLTDADALNFTTDANFADVVSSQSGGYFSITEETATFEEADIEETEAAETVDTEEPETASAETEAPPTIVVTDTSGEYEYDLMSNGTITITGFTGDASGELVIPGELDGYAVTAIGEKAFASCVNLTKVTIPDGVTSIGDYAFSECKKLNSVVIPNSVTSIGEYAFNYCESLKGVALPEHITSIGKSAFYYCKALTRVVIPNGVTSIAEVTFCGCDNLAEVVIPNSVISIDFAAFSGCSNLTEVMIPSSVTSIGKSAFIHCTGLTEVVIPDGVTSIGQSAFEGCTNLTKVVIPESVTSFFGWTFNKCNLLTEAYFYGDVPSVWWSGVFLSSGTIYYIEGTDGWTSPTWTAPDGRVYNTATFVPESADTEDIEEALPSVVATGISGEYEYDLMSNGTITITGFTGDASGELVIPGELDGHAVTAIGEKAFVSCANLTKVTIPEGVTSIGERSFKGCENLTAVVIPEGVTSIGEYAFSSCRALTEVTLPDSVISIGDGAFHLCQHLTQMVLPDGITAIGAYTFEWCELLASVVIPEGVTSIGLSAFQNCFSLTDLVLPSSLTYIEAGAFYRCVHLPEIVIPDSVTFIGNHAFTKCDSLTEVVIPASVTSIGEEAFYSCFNLTKIIVEEGNPNYSSDSAGVLYNKDKTELIQSPQINAQRAYVIPDGVTSIEKYAFYNSGITSVEIPNSVTSIGDYAFYGCEFLTEAYFHGDVPANWGSMIFGSLPYSTEIVTDIYYIEGTAGWTSPTWTAPDGRVYNTATFVPESDE